MFGRGQEESSRQFASEKEGKLKKLEEQLKTKADQVEIQNQKVEEMKVSRFGIWCRIKFHMNIFIINNLCMK